MTDRLENRVNEWRGVYFFDGNESTELFFVFHLLNGQSKEIRREIRCELRRLFFASAYISLRRDSSSSFHVLRQKSSWLSLSSSKYSLFSKSSLNYNYTFRGSVYLI